MRHCDHSVLSWLFLDEKRLVEDGSAWGNLELKLEVTSSMEIMLTQQPLMRGFGSIVRFVVSFGPMGSTIFPSWTKSRGR